MKYNAFNVYRRELAPGTVSLTGDRAQGDDSKHCANSNSTYLVSSGLFILGHSNSKFSMGTHKGIYGNEIVRLNETYTVS